MVIWGGTYSLAVIEHVHPSLVHVRVQLLPGVTPVSGAVYGSGVGLHKDHFVGVTAPHDILQRPVDLEDLETNFVCFNSVYVINQISCTSVCQQGDCPDGEHALASSQPPSKLLIISLMFALVHLRMSA